MRWRTQACVAVLVILTCRSALFAADAPAADAKKTALTPSQQDAVAKIQAKGGLVIPLAANSDSLVVSLATAGKQAGDSELDLVKQLPKVVQLDLRNTAVTDKGLASLQGKPEQCRELLFRCLRAGTLPDIAHVATDADLAVVRDLGWFQDLLREARSRQSAAS